jgi:hypothetical protein
MQKVQEGVTDVQFKLEVVQEEAIKHSRQSNEAIVFEV